MYPISNLLESCRCSLCFYIIMNTFWPIRCITDDTWQSATKTLSAHENSICFSWKNKTYLALMGWRWLKYLLYEIITIHFTNWCTKHNYHVSYYYTCACNKNIHSLLWLSSNLNLSFPIPSPLGGVPEIIVLSLSWLHCLGTIGRCDGSGSWLSKTSCHMKQEMHEGKSVIHCHSWWKEPLCGSYNNYYYK